MKKILACIISIAFIQVVSAQVWYTRNGYISFFSHTAVEDIKAENFEVVSFLDAAKGDFRFQVLVKGFQFPKAAMQQHFNSTEYMNSTEFPKSELKGSITNIQEIDLTKDGTYNVEVLGDLTIHGVTKPIKEKGTITVKDGKPVANAVFKVKRTDYAITTPKFNATKIADEIEVTVKCSFEPYKSN